MNKHTVVEAILDASDELYSTGRKAEANILTSVARRVAQVRTDDWNPDDAATDAGFLGADEYDMQSENLNDDQGVGDFGDSTGPTKDDFEKYYNKLQAHHEGGESYDGDGYDGDGEGFEGDEDSDFGGFGAEQQERHTKHRNTDEFARLLDGAGADTERPFGDY